MPPRLRTLTFTLSRAVLMVVAMAIAAAVSASPLRLQLGREGDIYGWLVSGPYPNEGALELRGTGFRTDYLKDEASAAPTESEQWRFATGNRRLGTDLIEAISREFPAIGYCYTVIESNVDQDALLLFGSDDGAKVWLNGKQVFERQLARGVKRDEERVAIRLQRGLNRLLFKIEQGNGGWGLMARVVSPNGQPLTGVHLALPLDPDLRHGDPAVRAYRTRPGMLDLEALDDYRETSRTASRWLKHLRDRATEPERLEEALTSTASAVYAARGSASAINREHIVAAERIRREKAAARTALMAWAQNPGVLVKADPRREDFVRVMPGGRYFIHADGRTFTPIGYNHNPDWPELEQSHPLHADYEPARTDRWFANLKAHGVNVVRLMVETPPSGNLEEVPGTIRPEHLIWLDHVVAAARKHDVKLWVTPYDTFWMNLRADASPYWKANGGPIDNPTDFLTKPEIIELQKQRMKLLIDRYGNLGTIFAWEIMNEVDLWWKATPEQIRTWTNEMSTFVRDYQRQRWGVGPMVTISFAEPMPEGLNAETAFRRPDFDFATMHLYIGASRGPKPGDAEQAGIDFAKGVLYARRQVRDNRPVLDGESGPIDRWIADAAFDNEVFHAMSWHHLLAGGAGPGTRWPYRNPHHLTPGMLRSLKSMRAFTDGVPWAKLTGPEVILQTAVPGGALANTFATSEGAIAWLRGLSGGRVGLLWPGAARPARFRLFDVQKGTWLGPVRQSKDKDGIQFDVPAGVAEIAVWIERR